jgi:heptosyltransferase-2
MSKCLVIAPNWVGDTVMAVPVFQSLASSDRTVSVLARPHLEPLLELLPEVSLVLTNDGSDTGTLEQIRRHDFDEAVILPNSFRSALLPYRAAVERRWGYRARSPESLFRSLLLNPPIPRPDIGNRHQVEDYAELLSSMGAELPSDWTPRIEISTEGLEAGSGLLRRANIREDSGPIVGLFAGAEFGPSKKWPWKRFVELSRKLRTSRPDSQQVILAGPKELWQAVRIHEETGKIHPVIGPDLDLKRLAYAIAQIDLLITNDSGPMHLAAALGVPCLALFGPTNPTRTRPYGNQHRVLYSDRWCSPCFRRRCPLLHHRCMRDLTVEDVTDQALKMLDQASGAVEQ